jgi:tetratricopeptide (TPR) repeat protein
MAYYLKKQGEILFELKQFEEALKIFEMAIPREPQNLSLVRWREKVQEQIKLQPVSPQKPNSPDLSANKQTPVPSQPRAQESAQPKVQESKPVQAQPKAQESKPVQAQPKAQEKKPVQAQPKAQEPKPAQPKVQNPKPVQAQPKAQEKKPAQAQPKAQEKKTKSEKLSPDKSTKAAFDHYLQGNMLYNDRKYQDALMAYDIALHLDPKNAEYFCGRGRAFAALNHHEKALLAFTEAVQQKPNTPDYLRLKGETLYALGRYEKSLNAFRTAADLSPNVASYHEMQGEIYCKLGRLELALRAFKRAIKLEPDNPNYLARQKQIQAQLNSKGNVQSSSAASDYQSRKVSLDKYNQGMGLYQQKNYQQALKAFDNAARLESQNPTYHHARGLALTQLRRYSDALLALDEAIRLHPNFREALSQKAEVLKAMGRNIEAEQTMIINRKLNVDRNIVAGQNNDNPNQENLFQKFLKRLFD